jgi:hypothetical protein
VTLAGFLHAWAFALALGALLAVIAFVPARLLGIGVSLVVLVEAAFWLALGVIALAEVAVLA